MPQLHLRIAYELQRNFFNASSVCGDGCHTELGAHGFSMIVDGLVLVGRSGDPIAPSASVA
jgi:hypothetical protein